MSKVKQLFEIDDFNLWDKEIEVFLIQGEKEKEKSISRAKFEKWLEDSGRLDYCNDAVDHEGEHVQVTGTIDIENYWDDILLDKRQHLYDYILLNIDPEKIFDIESPLKRILEDAFSHLNPQP